MFLWTWLILSSCTLRSCLGYIFLLVSSLPEHRGICVVSILTRHCHEEKAILFWDILLCCPGWPWTSELSILLQCCKYRPLSPGLAVRGLNRLKQNNSYLMCGRVVSPSYPGIWSENSEFGVYSTFIKWKGRVWQPLPSQMMTRCLAGLPVILQHLHHS